jgi:glycosyltransferase involved in cell wall biosynthesis
LLRIRLRALPLTAELRNLGFASQLLAGRPDPAERTASGANSADGVVTALQRNFHASRDVRAFLALCARLRSSRPDIVHTHLAKAGALGRLAACASGVPVTVHTFHGHVLRGYFSPQATQLFLQAERALARRTDALIAVSDAIRDDLLALGVGRPGQWHVFPLGLDLRPLWKAPDNRLDCRTRLGLLPGDPVVAFVGRVVRVKDPETFLATAALVLDEMPHATFLVAGDGDQRGRMQAEARAQFGDRMRFVGWVDDVVTLYGAADVVLLTSRHEGTPATLIEAAAAGRPVVSTDVGGVRDVVVNALTGYLAPGGDAAALAGATLGLLRDPARAAAMGAEGRRRSHRFSTVRLASDLALLYAELLARRVPRRPRARLALTSQPVPAP